MSDLYDNPRSAEMMAAFKKTARNNLSFEERLEETLFWIELRQHRDLYGMDWEDVRQELLLRVMNQFPKFDPAKGDYSHWINRVLTNHLKNMLRSAQGMRPCIWQFRDGKSCRCPHNLGGDKCALTASGEQSHECPLFAKWAHNLRVRIPDPLQMTNEHGEDYLHPEAAKVFAEPPEDTFDHEAAQRVIDGLPEETRRVINEALQFKKTQDASGDKVSLKNGNLYAQFKRAKPLLRYLYENERRDEAGAKASRAFLRDILLRQKQTEPEATAA